MYRVFIDINIIYCKHFSCGNSFSDICLFVLKKSLYIVNCIFLSKHLYLENYCKTLKVLNIYIFVSIYLILFMVKLCLIQGCHFVYMLYHVHYVSDFWVYGFTVILLFISAVSVTSLNLVSKLALYIYFVQSKINTQINLQSCFFIVKNGTKHSPLGTIYIKLCHRRTKPWLNITQSSFKLVNSESFILTTVPITI